MFHKVFPICKIILPHFWVVFFPVSFRSLCFLCKSYQIQAISPSSTHKAVSVSIVLMVLYASKIVSATRKYMKTFLFSSIDILNFSFIAQYWRSRDSQNMMHACLCAEGEKHSTYFCFSAAVPSQTGTYYVCRDRN